MMKTVGKEIAAGELHLLVHLEIKLDLEPAQRVGVGGAYGLRDPARGHRRVRRRLRASQCPARRTGYNAPCAIRARVILQQGQARWILRQPLTLTAGLV